MTSDDSLLLILRRLDEIERKLDHMLEEIRTPAAIGYSARRATVQEMIEASVDKSLRATQAKA
jgi:hypothetical protein